MPIIITNSFFCFCFVFFALQSHLGYCLAFTVQVVYNLVISALTCKIAKPWNWSSKIEFSHHSFYEVSEVLLYSTNSFKHDDAMVSLSQTGVCCSSEALVCHQNCYTHSLLGVCQYKHSLCCWLQEQLGGGGYFAQGHLELILLGCQTVLLLPQPADPKASFMHVCSCVLKLLSAHAWMVCLISTNTRITQRTDRLRQTVKDSMRVKWKRKTKTARKESMDEWGSKKARRAERGETSQNSGVHRYYSLRRYEYTLKCNALSHLRVHTRTYEHRSTQKCCTHANNAQAWVGRKAVEAQT